MHLKWNANEPMVWQHTSFSEYHQAILQQANLAALKEISGNIIIFGLAVVILLIAWMVYKKLRKMDFTAF